MMQQLWTHIRNIKRFTKAIVSILNDGKDYVVEFSEKYLNGNKRKIICKVNGEDFKNLTIDGLRNCEFSSRVADNLSIIEKTAKALKPGTNLENFNNSKVSKKMYDKLHSIYRNIFE